MNLITQSQPVKQLKYNYYKDQLARIEVGKTEYAPTIKVFANGNGDNTHNLSLNPESAKALITWLKKNYIKK